MELNEFGKKWINIIEMRLADLVIAKANSSGYQIQSRTDYNQRLKDIYDGKYVPKDPKRNSWLGKDIFQRR